jgi:hypothetical protein
VPYRGRQVLGWLAVRCIGEVFTRSLLVASWDRNAGCSTSLLDLTSRWARGLSGTGVVGSGATALVFCSSALRSCCAQSLC